MIEFSIRHSSAYVLLDNILERLPCPFLVDVPFLLMALSFAWKRCRACDLDSPRAVASVFLGKVTRYLPVDNKI